MPAKKEPTAGSVRSPKGSGTSIAIELKDYPELLSAIREAAKADDREPSKWVRRRLAQLYTDGVLFP